MVEHFPILHLMFVDDFRNLRKFVNKICTCKCDRDVITSFNRLYFCGNKSPKTSIKCENFMHRLVCRHWQTKLFLCEDMDIQ